MKLKQRNERSGTDLFFTLSLFGVFAACSFLLIMIGVRVYQSSVISMEDTYSTHTSLAYVAEKIRQHDRSGTIALTSLNGKNALVLEDSTEDATYLTYIYSDDEYLYELSVKEGASVSADLGEKILSVKEFSVTPAGNGFLELSACDSSGNSTHFFLHMRSETFD